MNQYCYNILQGKVTNPDTLKNFISGIYKKTKFGDLAFDENLPFIVLYSEKENQVCIKMTSRAKKNIERIEGIHNLLKTPDLKFGVIVLDKPKIFQLQQCAWWDTECKAKLTGRKWETLEHKGPYFTHLMEPYEPHGTPIIYGGVKYKLTPQEERIANFYARRIISEQGGTVALIWTKDKVFNQNFWNDFKKYLTPERKKIFTDFSKLDFSLIVDKLKQLKEVDKSADKVAKKVRVAEKKQNYGYATINGVVEPVGNFTIEPAAIFYGRGENPNRGKIKRDIEPEEVIINIGEGAKVPEPPVGHKWNKVIHDHTVAWIASWKEPISGENKYVYFGAEGQLKGKSDLEKYEKARKLNKFIDPVRQKYTLDMNSDNPRLKQLGTVLYLIDNYGLRVGGEKDDTEADTVGASTLRVEHVKLPAGKKNVIVFDFLGKDSIPYYKELVVNDIVYRNIKDFMTSKIQDAEIFNLISANDINNYLKTFDRDFTAKVFRTRLGSTTMDDALKGLKIKKNITKDELKTLFIKANASVAQILNHKRTISEKSKELVEKYKKELQEIEQALQETEEQGKSTTRLETRIAKKKAQIESKKSTLDVAATTSLTNYIDPRIVVSWTKSKELPINKVYTATLQRKFKWAIDTTNDKWDYNKTPLASDMATLIPSDEQLQLTPAKRLEPTFGHSLEKSAQKKRIIKRVVKPKTQVSAPIHKPEPTIVEPIFSRPRNVQLVKYSDYSVAIIGDTKVIKEQLQQMGGKYNPNLTIQGKKTAGWIFSKKREPELLKFLDINPPESFIQKKLPLSVTGIELVQISNDEFIVIGNITPLKSMLTTLGGREANKIQIITKVQDGIIFPLKEYTRISKILEDLSKDMNEINGQMWDEITKEILGSKVLSQKQMNVLNCFSKNSAVIDFVKKEVQNGDTFSKQFLIKFLLCIDIEKFANTMETERTKLQQKSLVELQKILVDRLTPDSLESYMFIAYILMKTNERTRYLTEFVRLYGDYSEMQECLNMFD